MNVLLTEKGGSVMDLCEIGVYYIGRPSARTFAPGVTVSSTVHGGIWRPKAIGRSTQPHPAAGAQLETAESTACLAERVGKGYNWLSVHSNSYIWQAGARKTEN